jgi:hypothetical protein
MARRLVAARRKRPDKALGLDGQALDLAYRHMGAHAAMIKQPWGKASDPDICPIVDDSGARRGIAGIGVQRIDFGRCGGGG